MADVDDIVLKFNLGNESENVWLNKILSRNSGHSIGTDIQASGQREN